MLEIKNEFKKTEAGYIPVEWAAKSLNDISEINKGKQLSKLNMLGGEYYVLNGGQVPSGYHTTFNTPENTISISEGGNSCGFVKFNKEKFWSGGHNYTLSLRENINILFLYHYLKYKENIIMSLRVGSGLPNIQKKALQNFYISVPPLKEQQKIAEILSTVDEQIEKTDQLIEKTKELKKGLMQQLLTKGIGHTEFKQSELGDIPVEWEIATLGSIVDISSGLSPSKIQTLSKEGEYPFFKVNDLNFCVKYLDNAIYNFEDSISLQIKKDSIIFPKRGASIFTNKIAIVNKSGLMDTNLMALYVKDKKKVNFEFIYYYLLNRGLSEIADTSSVPQINNKHIEPLKISLPKFEEQQKITNILSSVDEELEGYEEEKAQYEELKKGLMQQLLTGKTRVKVD